MKSNLVQLLLIVCAVHITNSPILNDDPILRSEHGSPVQSIQIRDEKSYDTQPRDFFRNGIDDISLESDVSSDQYAFNNPAGCAIHNPTEGNPEVMLANVQIEIGGQLQLKDRQIGNIWNGTTGSFQDISQDPYVYEFEVDQFKYPFTYLGDQVVTSFVQNGFAVWFRSYGGLFRLMAVPMIPGVENSLWNDYVSAYWSKDGLPDDEYIVPVSKKLPCHWMIDEGYVSNKTVQEMFNFDHEQPDYLSAGRQYLASSCSEAYQVSREKIGYWDATSMCGPLTWQIIHDANSFPYRIGNYQSNADLFISANPRYGGKRPWIGFDPETYDMVVRTKLPMAGYDFESEGDLFPGDILFSYGSPDQWAKGGGNFSHIFLVAGIDENNSRVTVSNLVKNHPGSKDCFIRELILYTPGDRETGMINYGWNDHGYGSTGVFGFDVFRWKWITFHLQDQPREYTVRRGETVETIAHDWKVPPHSIIQFNHLFYNNQLIPGQTIIIPAPNQYEEGDFLCQNCLDL